MHPHKHIEKRIIILIILAFVVLSAVIIFASVRSHTQSEERSAPKILPRESNFKDEELGVALYIPEGWGTTTIKNNFSGIENMREITFSDQPNVKLIALTPYRLYSSELDHRGVAALADIDVFCRSLFEYYSGNEESGAQNGEDIFRQNGSYNFGNCAAMPPVVNLAKKVVPEHDSWTPFEESKALVSRVELARSFFWPLDNEVYGALTLQIDVPDITSDGFCTRQISYGDNEYELHKKFGCINHAERDLIESAFKDFEMTEFSKEIDVFVASVKPYPVETAATYKNYFKDTAVFDDTDLGISFRYPRVFGVPRFDAEYNAIIFPDNKAEPLRIFVSTLASVQQAEKDLEECDGVCGLSLTEGEWRGEKDLLARASIGEVACVADAERCEIAQVGKIKMLINTFTKWPRSEGVSKEYVVYVGTRRFEFRPISNDVFTDSIAEYAQAEQTDFTLRTALEIIESLVVTK